MGRLRGGIFCTFGCVIKMDIMKKLLLLILYMGWSLGMQAQEGAAAVPAVEPDTLSVTAPAPSLPFTLYGVTPFRYQGCTWDLHAGFNASLGMNVSVGFGKNRLHGVGFGQDAAFLYAFPVTKRLSVAAGVYATNLQWADYAYRNVGVTALAAFQVNERLTLYGYGNKSILPQKRLPAYPMPNFTPDKFGGMLHLKLGESASISLGVEAIKNTPSCYYSYW